MGGLVSGLVGGSMYVCMYVCMFHGETKLSLLYFSFSLVDPWRLELVKQ